MCSLVGSRTSKKYFKLQTCKCSSFAITLFSWTRNLQFRAATKISSCSCNTYCRKRIQRLEFLLILFFFYFPVKVAGGHIHSSRRNPQPLPLKNSPGNGLAIYPGGRSNIPTGGTVYNGLNRAAQKGYLFQALGTCKGGNFTS